MIEPCFPGDSTGRFLVLPIPIPTLIRDKYGSLEADFGVKDLILVQALECFFESTNTFYDLATYHNVTRGGYRGFSAQEESEQGWWLDQRVGLDTKSWCIVASEVFGVPCPAVPILSSPIDHSSRRL